MKRCKNYFDNLSWFFLRYYTLHIEKPPIITIAKKYIYVAKKLGIFGFAVE